jgi:hypothetical protein
VRIEGEERLCLTPLRFSGAPIPNPHSSLLTPWAKVAPMLQRHDLEAMQRDRLVERARAAGVERPEVLTRLELIDEILSMSIADEQERKAARGLLGRARDLVARVVEKGLNLPDAAQRLRTLAPPMAAWRRGPPPIATVSLAEIYAGQGHHNLALKVLDEVLEREPDHAYARELHARVIAGRAAAQTPVAPEPAPPAVADPPVVVAEEPVRPAAVVPPPPAPPRAAVPTRDALQLDVRQRLARLSWQLRPSTFARARVSKPDGHMILRLAFVEPGWEGPRVKTEDRPIDALTGRLDLAVSENTQGVCAALGWLTQQGFAPLASVSIAPETTPGP